jgi:hypothetical protein
MDPDAIEDPVPLDDIIELGDYVVIDSTAYGRITGTVVYRSLERISIQPAGISNYIQHLTVHQADSEGETFDEKDGVQAVYIIEKRTATTFVEQHNLRVGQTIDTFDVDHEPATTYEVIGVEEETDTVTLRDPSDPEQPLEIVFGGVGLELDAPFAVLRVRPVVLGEERPAAEAAEPVDAEAAEAEEPAAEAEEAAEEEFEVVGVVEIAQAKIFREAAAYEQRIPDDLQKIDALNDFLAGLNPSVQKDPRAIRSIRILVETLFHLKQETVQYHPDGNIEGPKPVTVTTLQELIQRTPVPLGRPVLAVNKRLYTYQFEGQEEPDEPVEAEGVYYVDAKEEMALAGKSGVAVSKGDLGGSIREWREQQEHVRRFEMPWQSPEGTRGPEGATGEAWTALLDTEFLRVPSQDSAVTDVVGFLPSNMVGIAPTLDTVPFSIARALGPTYRKRDGRAKGQKQVLHPADTAPLAGYLLFPLSTLAHGLGATRTGLLAHDSARSQLPRRLLSDLLKHLDEAEDATDATELLLLRSDHYAITDYVESMRMPDVLGISDAMSLLTHYGLDRFELTEDLHEILQEKTEAAQAQLVSALASLRALLASVEEPQAQPTARLPAFFATLRKQPLLLSLMEEFERTHPNIIQTPSAGIGLLAFLLRHAGNYTQVAAGENPLQVAHAFQQAGLSEYLRHVRIAQQLRIAQTTVVERPKKNSCEHVAALVSIRRIVDDGERFLQLTQFFKRFQGPRDQNWINCTICKEHLLCMHERLQIQAFLNAKEKATIEKQVILGFSGGVFQGKYICRNCGQPIRDLDFDNNIEFDDDGKPKSGRAVLVDQDALFEEHLDQLISAPVSAKEGAAAAYMLNTEERKVYHVARELADRLGVTIEFEGYRRIIEDTQKYMNELPTREVYGSRKGLMYEVFVARFFVTSVAAFLLLEIQSHVPVYLVRFTLMGCPDPGFDGWPLSADRTALQGVRYMACAVSSTTRKDPPWGETGFMKLADDAKRTANIMKYIENVLDQVAPQPDVQVRLSMKRRYVLDVLGRSVEGESVAFSKERTPPTFLPEMVVLSPSEAAKDVITPEVMEQMGQKGQYALAKLWIRQSHVAARQTARLVRGSPFAETTCCTAKLTEPAALGAKKLARAEAEAEADAPQPVFPDLAARALRPKKQGSFLLTHFHPRAADTAVVEPNADLYYRVFLKCCFTGPRVGHLHQPGLTHRCIWCGLQFPTHPAVMDADTEGKAALSEVETSTEAFTKLLDTIHRVNQVAPLPRRTITPLDTLMKEFGAVHPTPFPEWKEMLHVTIEQCKKLAPTAQKDEVAQAVGQLSLLAREFEQTVHQGRRFTEAHRGVMSTIVDLPWSNFFSVVQTYFVVPMQRLLTQFNPDVLKVPIELERDLSKTHVDTDLTPILKAEVAYLQRFETLGADEQMELARAKMAHFVEQWVALMPFAQRVRPIAVPGRERMLGYVKRALWYGILAGLLDSGMGPIAKRTVMASVNDPSARQILEVVATLVKKFNTEKLSYDDQEIRDMIAVRDEKERVSVVKGFDRMTEEERAVELINKRLGLGKWAVGGTKLIYAYDKDYYDQEREKRIAAGNMDLSLAPEMPEGHESDQWGFPVTEEDADGYDVNQHADDDDE